MDHSSHRVATVGTLAARDEQRCLRRVLDSAGLKSEHYKAETLHRRLPAMLRTLRSKDAAQAADAMDRQPGLTRQAMNALIIGVTSFFRDEAVFDALQSYLAGSLFHGICLGRRRGPRVWSAGCSSGAELYSVGMLLKELGLLNNAEMLGTDCRPDAVNHASAGIYCDEEAVGLSQERLRRHFIRTPHGWRICQEIQSRTRWRTANVLCVREPGLWDIVVCRNLAIYLSAEGASELWSMLESSLSPGGLLVLGKAERPIGCRKLVSIAPCIYRRIGESHVA